MGVSLRESQILKLGRRRGQTISVDSQLVVVWEGEGYMKAVAKASREGLRRAANVVRREAIKRAPRARFHRVRRKYPSGFISSSTGVDARRLSNPRNIKVRVRRQAGTSNAFVATISSLPGYGLWQEYGTVNHPEQSFLRTALAASRQKVIPFLRAEWPK